MTANPSNLGAALDRLSRRSAHAAVARARLAHPALNRVLMSRLATAPGQSGAMFADPVFEMAKSWQPAAHTMGELEGRLLAPELIAALDTAAGQQMPRDQRPYAHQLAAWEASLVEGKSVLVTAGTGSGKTEAFLIPVLQDILAHPHPGGGVRAILLYPLNALIESQRERLSAWTRGLGGRVRFALYNSDTPETEREARIKSDKVELRSRRAIRERPPEILVTNITMLEYLLLRAQDRTILDASRGALRWIVLDEAHSYIGSQAAEMALLLRRVRAAFGVAPHDVRLMATSATIGGETDAPKKLRAFTAALSGRPEVETAVIEGREVTAPLPAPSPDRPIDVTALAELDPARLWDHLASHPRALALRQQMATGAVTLTEAARMLFDDPARRADAEAFLAAAARAEQDGHRLIPWRVHLFHRAQGGVWVCVNPGCEARDPELAGHEAAWPWGAVHLSPRARCSCGGPVYELVGCSECGQAILEGRLVAGAVPRLEPPDPGEIDDFALDAEPDESESLAAEAGSAWLAAGSGNWIDTEGRIYDNAAPDDCAAWPVRLIERADERTCCDGADRARIAPLRFGPAFFMGNALPLSLELVTEPLDKPGLPAGGRRALTFSDSRQGVARLAAKLQQDAERTLTRAYLWHAVQEGSAPDPNQVSKLEGDIKRLRAAGLDDLADEKQAKLDELRGVSSAPVPWKTLVERCAQQVELREFAGEVWRNRRLGREMADEPQKIAEMFLYRELFRRPRVQNNPETMGLLRLCFPELEAKATGMAVPRPLSEAGVDCEGWKGLALAAVDFVFRNYLAIDLPDWLVPLISPKFGALNFVVPAGTPSTERRTSNTRAWPGPVPTARPTRLHRLVYQLIGGSWADTVDQDRAAEVLEALWNLITTTATINMGGGAYRLDFNKAAVIRLDRAWLCPITRRPFGYHVAGRSPYDAAKTMPEVAFPRLPAVNAGGLSPAEREEIARWCESDPEVAALRARGLWTDLHDRIASYPPFLRAQEHSAQIPRSVLARYEEAFRDGRINLLNCSTTMEMGVDIPAVGLVANANVPPSLSNYRQRVGRAGRRGEPWAFALTFCRDLPLDRQAFNRPRDFLARPIVAPKVWFDSPSLIQRHVNAALLAAWLAEKGGVNVRGSIGAFLGAGQTLEETDQSRALANDFLADLRGNWGADQTRGDLLRPLLDGTALDGRPIAGLFADAADAFDSLVKRWREEHRALLEGAANASEADVGKSYELRARRFAGEFLLGELARRNFTPAYGFPTDVVAFDPLSGQFGEGEERNGFSYRSRGGASRELHMAIREYAPGAEVVIDGLVYESEGVLPAWGADADASRLEDLHEMWICGDCHAFGQASVRPAACRVCGNLHLEHRKVLRPAGFLSRKRPHTGYETLAHVPLEPVRLSAQSAEWIALPHEDAGRMRADAAGQVATTAAGPRGGGYAICLDCGRAAPMGPLQHDTAEPLPEAIRRHYPLHRGKGTKLTRDGLCAGSDAPQRIQRNIYFAQVTRTDVWEWQLPPGSAESTARALAAGLREALCERMGVETAEIGPAVGRSRGPAGEGRISAFLYDRAAGGAGLVARMAEPEMLAATIERATELLDCPEGCLRGCPACILRPDINQRGLVLERPSALALIRGLKARLNLPPELRLFGPETRLLGRPLAREIEQSLTMGSLKALEVWLHGAPESWDFGDWPLTRMLARLGQAGIAVKVHIPKAALGSAGFDLACKLALHRVAAFARLMLVDEPPQAGGHPILALLTVGEMVRAAAATRVQESLPDSAWGAGSAGPVVVGPAPELPPVKGFSAEKLMEYGTGNARVLWPKTTLDGFVADFGRRFWEWLARQAPLEVVAMRDTGIERISYSDRYLLTPLTLRLLTAVVRAAPGASEADIKISLAMADRHSTNPRFVFDNFPDDGIRNDVARELLPGAQVTIGHKADLPHRRFLRIDLRDGRQLVALLDQGFGAWRATGTVRHEFNSDADRQARELMRAKFEVRIHDDSDAPMTISWSK